MALRVYNKCQGDGVGARAPCRGETEQELFKERGGDGGGFGEGKVLRERLKKSKGVEVRGQWRAGPREPGQGAWMGSRQSL